MMLLKAVLIFLGLSVLVGSIWWLIYLRAPIGYEDETGFHYGEPKDLP